MNEGEEGILTLPMLKIFKSVDNQGTGRLTLVRLKSIFIEYFPVLNSKDIMTLLQMAETLNSKPGEVD